MTFVPKQNQDRIQGECEVTLRLDLYSFVDSVFNFKENLRYS